MDETKVRWLLIVSVSGNLLLLIFFKYTNFLVEIVNIISLQRVTPITKTPSVHLPLGISFFTFHGLSYIIDVYRNKVQVEWNPVTLGLYFSFFPQLIAGPIVRYHDVAHQLIKNRRFDRKEFVQGAVEFTLGLSKKMLIANTVGVVADSIFNLPIEKLNASHAWLGLLAYTLQIYFDFSGYSDMAIGLAHIFGIRFPENFNYPYISRSIREFWRRWHISLSSWFRDYLYISLGGNRVSKVRVYFNLLVVFFLCGLWHGASWNFIIWGLFHGTFLVLERTIIFKWILGKLPRILQHFYALIIISFGWVFFRAPNLVYSIEFIKTLLGLQLRRSHMNIPAKQYVDRKVIVVILFAIFGSTGFLSTCILMLKDTLNRILNKHARMLAELVLGVQRVIIGKHGWLFLNEFGPTDPKGFSGWQGYDPYSLNQLISIQKNLEDEYMWFTKKNITFLILPAPEKNSIYSEYLPWQFGTIIGPSRQAQIFEHMKLHSKLELIDTRQTLIMAKKKYSLDTYFKTDTHWNTIGAFFAYEEIMKRLLIVYPQFVPHRFENFIQDRNLKQRGDLAEMANLDVSDILEHQLIPKQNVSYNNAGLKKEKILFFGDSFSNLFLKDYFWRHFKDVKFATGGRSANEKLEKQIVLNYQPDVVIFEAVERYWTRA